MKERVINARCSEEFITAHVHTHQHQADTKSSRSPWGHAAREWEAPPAASTPRWKSRGKRTDAGEQAQGKRGHPGTSACARERVGRMGWEGDAMRETEEELRGRGRTSSVRHVDASNNHA